jgi:hypothetical protein
MKRGAFLLIALGSACLALAAPQRQAGADPDPGYVVVDPTDLRQPVADPEQGLTEKYDGKVVRFTGVARRVTQDKKTKKYGYEVHFDIVQAAPRGKKPAAGKKETIVVPVTFLKDETQLRKQLQGARPVFPRVVVQGRGSVMVDGTLVISDAVLVGGNPLFSGR